jgi:hypothetical protein
LKLEVLGGLYLTTTTINVRNTKTRLLFPARNPVGAWVENHSQHEHEKPIRTTPAPAAKKFISEKSSHDTNPVGERTTRVYSIIAMAATSTRCLTGRKI